MGRKIKNEKNESYRHFVIYRGLIIQRTFRSSDGGRALGSVAVSNSLEGSLLVTVYSCDDCSEKLAISEAGILKSSRTRMPPKKMMQGWRVYATLMLYVVPLFESPMVTMYDDVCV